MILRIGNGMAASAAALALTALCAVPAQADVLEISAAGDARWIAGGNAMTSDADAVIFAGALAQVPEDVIAILPEEALANTQLHASGIPQIYADHVETLARRFDLSPALIEAVVWQESRWRADAVSPVGARGLAQLMPGTARDLGVDPDDPLANLEGGARYLREQLDRFDGDLERALAAYNAGPGRVIRSGGIPRIRETQVYVASIMGRLADHSRSPE